MSKGLPKQDATYGGAVHVQVSRYVAVPHAVRCHFPNVRNKEVWNAGVAPIDRLRAVLFTAAAILGVRLVSEIAERIVRAIAVNVRNLQPFRRRSRESLKDKPMDSKHLAPVRAAQIDREVAVPFHDRLEMHSAVVAEDAALVGNKVEAFVSDDSFERLEHAAEYHKTRSHTRFGQVGRVYVCPEMLAAA